MLCAAMASRSKPYWLCSCVIKLFSQRGAELDRQAGRVVVHPGWYLLAIEPADEVAPVLRRAAGAVDEEHRHLVRIEGLEQVDAAALFLHEAERLPQPLAARMLPAKAGASSR